MLQIVTKMYFREGVPLNSRIHREVLFTNRSFLSGDTIELPVGELAPQTSVAPVSTVTASVMGHLEAEDPDGQPSILIAVGGEDVIDDLADVLSFCLNAVFSRNGDLVRRLVPNSLDASSRSAASKLFRDTFDAHRAVLEPDLEDLRDFMSALIVLRRSTFEAAMRAIRRTVRATQRAVDDPTIAYVDLVAAIESLSDGAMAPAPEWVRLDPEKRRLIDDALESVEPDIAEGVRTAVIEAERLGARSRFVAFVTAHVSREYFRSEAKDATFPVRGPDLERALKLAYDVRSRNVHVLKDLPPEALVLGERADTVSPPGMGTMLSLEGLARLARHVIRAYVAEAPVEVDAAFNWRAALPGQVLVQLAPQYWLWNADAFDYNSVQRYFSGFVANLAQALGHPQEPVADMRKVLERIEAMLPGTAPGAAKTQMVAIYALWHRILSTDHHRPDAARVLAEHEQLLERPELPAFVAGLLSNRLPGWTDDQWQGLALHRHAERSRRSHIELPAGIDAALQVEAAEHLTAAGRTEEATMHARLAVEELPGNQHLIAWEQALARGETLRLDFDLIVGGAPPSGIQGDTKEAPVMANENAGDSTPE